MAILDVLGGSHILPGGVENGSKLVWVRTSNTKPAVADELGEVRDSALVAHGTTEMVRPSSIERTKLSWRMRRRASSA